MKTSKVIVQIENNTDADAFLLCIQNMLRAADSLQEHIRLISDQHIPETPIDMELFCPRCGTQHIDQSKDNWINAPHRTHLCQQEKCGFLFRPANVATNGVEKLP